MFMLKFILACIYVYETNKSNIKVFNKYFNLLKITKVGKSFKYSITNVINNMSRDVVDIKFFSHVTFYE